MLAELRGIDEARGIITDCINERQVVEKLAHARQKSRLRPWAKRIILPQLTEKRLNIPGGDLRWGYLPRNRVVGQKAHIVHVRLHRIARHPVFDTEENLKILLQGRPQPFRVARLPRRGERIALTLIRLRPHAATN